MSRSVITDSVDQSIRFWAYDAAGAAVTGEAYNSAGMAVSVVVRSAGRILSTTALTLVARSGVGVHTDSALTEVSGGEYVVDLPDSYSATADRDISLTVASTAITGTVIVETLSVGNAHSLESTITDLFGTVVSGIVAASPAPTEFVFNSDLGDTSKYFDVVIRFTSGLNSNLVRPANGFGASGGFSVDETWPFIPSDGDTFNVISLHEHSTTQIAQQVNIELVDVLTVDTHAELSAPPAATSSIKDKLTWLFMWARNKATESATERKLFADDTTTVVSTETVGESAGVFTKGEAV